MAMYQRLGFLGVWAYSGCDLCPCSEMSQASEELTSDNCAVSQEVVQLREDKASQAQNLEALQVWSSP